ncbi:AMP-binding enzyme [Paracoccus laeviglucosivorans]|uniref:AMP-binding enzyme n=1 Tax=Paracoccus laeviglucosivorans TaxID=1197861 RepID=A0A521FT23_9RHOB|nr:AMP-binding enzyme [Paracoccus laeviglucosivorans]
MRLGGAVRTGGGWGAFCSRRGPGDIVQNCFRYHLSPEGMMFESAARAVDSAVVPAGDSAPELQVRACSDIGSTVYAGPPDFLRAIMQKADEMAQPLSLTPALMMGQGLTADLRREYADRGIAVTQCYATADLGLIAYETPSAEEMVVDERVIVEIVRPGSGEPLPDGEMGEVLVTTLNPDYPLVRFATGDMSAAIPGQSPCGRTNMRIRGVLDRVR